MNLYELYFLIGIHDSRASYEALLLKTLYQVVVSGVPLDQVVVSDSAKMKGYQIKAPL